MLFASVSLALDYPARTVKLVVTLVPGGTNDLVGRLFAQKLSDHFRQPFVVENRAGGNGIPGAAYVAKSAADGYTLLLGNTTLLGIQPSLFSNLPYDAQQDFEPVSVIAVSPSVLLVHPSVKAQSVGELIALAKANPGKLNYASPGTGSPHHLSAELFKSLTGTDIVHISYKGGAPAVNDLYAGRVQIMFAQLPDVLGHIRGGKLRALATTGAKRLSLLPDVPTLEETGINLQSVSWFAIVAPKGTPKEAIAALYSGIVKVRDEPDLRKRLLELSAEPLGTSPEETAAHIRSEIAKWAKVIKASGAKADG